jgi:hypothetical protein
VIQTNNSKTTTVDPLSTIRVKFLHLSGSLTPCAIYKRTGTAACSLLWWEAYVDRK